MTVTKLRACVSGSQLIFLVVHSFEDTRLKKSERIHEDTLYIHIVVLTVLVQHFQQVQQIATSLSQQPRIAPLVF